MFGETTAIVLMIGLDNHWIVICIHSVFQQAHIFQQLEEREETLTLKTSKFNFYKNKHDKLWSNEIRNKNPFFSIITVIILDFESRL